MGSEDHCSEKRKIVWPKQFIVDNYEILIITVDGTNCAIWEPKHNNLAKDKWFFSHKKNMIMDPCYGLSGSNRGYNPKGFAREWNVNHYFCD
jgi:hypothetical protein